MLKESMTLYQTQSLPFRKTYLTPHITGTSSHQAEGAAESCAGEGGDDDQGRLSEEPDLEG